MIFALTTRWNAGRHTDGAAMLEEILDLGIDHVELGYDLTLDLVSGVRSMVEQGAVKVDSLHNFCPVPLAAPGGHPEVFTLASDDHMVRQQAIRYTTETIRFAAELGATTVVTHAGNVSMTRYTGQLLALFEAGEQFSMKYEKTKMKLQSKREKKATRPLRHLYSGLEALLPVLEDANIVLAIENLPTWEALPTELEMEELLRHFDSPHIRAWHDIGHARIRQNLGFINHEKWLERLAPYTAGFHIHDVLHPGRDHVMPPGGDIDFSRLARFGRLPRLRVIEPTPRTTKEDIVNALAFLREVWGDEQNTTDNEKESGEHA